MIPALAYELEWWLAGLLGAPLRVGIATTGRDTDQPGPRRPSTPHSASAMRCLPHCTQTCIFGSGLSLRRTNLCSPNRQRHVFATRATLREEWARFVEGLPYEDVCSGG